MLHDTLLQASTGSYATRKVEFINRRSTKAEAKKTFENAVDLAERAIVKGAKRDKDYAHRQRGAMI